MLRISEEAKKLHVTQNNKPRSSNRALLSEVEKKTTSEQRNGGVLLIGGADYDSLALRQAQSVLRLDRQPSYWSHAALILDWPTVDQAIGAEVTLDPQDRESMVPERNGVSLFRLARYLDSTRYPNLAFITLNQDDEKGNFSLSNDVVDAALNPNRNRQRFPFWDWLAVWSQYMYAAGHVPSPIVDGTPWPGAAFVEYAYEAVGIDVTPGATAPNACPETLWSTFLYWYKGLKSQAGQAVTVQAWSRVRDDVCAGRKGLSPVLKRSDFAKARDLEAVQAKKKRSTRKPKRKT